MRIEILDLLPGTESGQGLTVTFSGMSGRAWARWCGSEMPEVGVLVDVEVDVPDEITQWASVDGPAEVASGAPGAPVRIRGVVDAVDEDSVLAVRVGADIVLVEFAGPTNAVQSGQVDKPRVGESVEFTTPRMDVYPYSV